MHADEYRLYVDDAPPSRNLLAGLNRLRSDPAYAGVTWKIIRLGAATPRHEQLANAALALADGIRYLPTLALADEKGLYARVIGAVGTREGRSFAERLAQARAMKKADRSGLAGRLTADAAYARLYELIGEASCFCDGADARTIAAMEADVSAALDHPAIPPALRQHVTLTILYPLALRRYALAYNGAHTPESEALFLRAVGILEHARDMDPTSETGRKAHQLREELRRARLQAARMD